jgi:multisubunit Na+/H+ antiporter MnhB subunit
MVVATDPFGPYLFADITRLILAAAGIVLVMVCVRVAWLRAHAPQDSTIRDRSSWGLVSYAVFALHPTVNALTFLGDPPHTLFLVTYAFALVTGIWAVFGQVTFRTWWFRSEEPTS